MTTATDWDDATWTDTGSHAVVTSVTTAPTETRFLPSVPPAAEFYREPTREQIQAEPTPQAGAHIPTTDDLTKRIDLTMASYRLVLHHEFKARRWHEVASQAWAQQGTGFRVSQRYTDKREALMTAYERECQAIKHGLRSTAPAVAGQVYDDENGWVQEHPDRTDVERMKRASQERLQRRERARRQMFESARRLDDDGATLRRVQDSLARIGAEPRSPWWRRLLERWG